MGVRGLREVQRGLLIKAVWVLLILLMMMMMMMLLLMLMLR